MTTTTKPLANNLTAVYVDDALVGRVRQIGPARFSGSRKIGTDQDVRRFGDRFKSFDAALRFVEVSGR